MVCATAPIWLALRGLTLAASEGDVQIMIFLNAQLRIYFPLRESWRSWIRGGGA